LSALEDRLRGHVQVLAGEIGERHVGRPLALRAAAEYVRTTLGSLGFEVAAQSYHTHGMRCDNLEVVIPGRKVPGEIIVVGAHYDTVPGSPGADDNASGVAGVIEIAGALRERQLERTVKLVAFVNEEPPFYYFGDMGSKIYAQAARRRGDDIRVMLSLEMLGCYTEVAHSQRYPPLLRYVYPDRGNFIAFVSNLRSRRALRHVVRAFRAHCDFPAESLASPAIVPGVAWSDQLSFWRAGFPGIMVTDTAFYRYAHYHQVSDTPEKIRYPEMARVVSGLAATIAFVAGGR
jgi:Zn-dependent M28 family amino/carboxypeptidase